MEIKISIIDIFLFFLIVKIKKANRRANPKWIALAGNPLKRPIPNINGNGEAYQSWNKDQIIAMLATIFKCKPERRYTCRIDRNWPESIGIDWNWLVLSGWPVRIDQVWVI